MLDDFLAESRAKLADFDRRLAKLEADPIGLGKPAALKPLTPDEIVAALLNDREIGAAVQSKIVEMKQAHER